MNYWIFRCDPKRYRLADRLNDAGSNPAITWHIGQHTDEIQRGDVAVVWENGPKGGIRALIRIDSEPRVMPELDSELKYCVGLDDGPGLRVLGTIIKTTRPIPPDEVRNAGLEEMAIFTAFKQGTNYSVRGSEVSRLLRLIGET
jgi:hypothetical protein